MTHEFRREFRILLLGGACMALASSVLAAAPGSDIAPSAQFEACTAKIDTDTLIRLETDNELVEEQLDALCEQGKRAQAQSLATEKVAQLRGSDVWRQLLQCLEVLDDGDETGGLIGFDPDKEHICDVDE